MITLCGVEGFVMLCREECGEILSFYIQEIILWCLIRVWSFGCELRGIWLLVMQ